jgi:hypothetical protein
MSVDTRAFQALETAGTTLARAEDVIALVARATPLDVHAEVRRLVAHGLDGARLRPAFRYGPVPDLSGVRRSLERIASDVAALGPVGRLLARRAAELDLEAQLAENVGTPAFAALAARRFPAPTGALAARVATFVEQACSEVAGPPAADARVSSDDRACPASLVSKLARGAAELGLSVRVEVRPQQLAIAATGHGLVAVRPGISLSHAAAARIALHELLAHALPRARAARAPLALFRAGTVGCVECEEGRALLIEERAGYLDVERRKELAFRHLGALAVRRGADFHETVRELAEHGADARLALEIAVRVHRGGGLAREIVYLPAYDEVRCALASEPRLEGMLERGRVGLEAARELHALGAGPLVACGFVSNSANPGP